MATSEKQLAANRRNARNSTGPKTPEGKAASSRNALKHGIFSRTLEHLDEDERANVVAVHDGLVQAYAPVGALEESIVARIALLLYRGSRITAAETTEVAHARAAVGWTRRQSNETERARALDALARLRGAAEDYSEWYLTPPDDLLRELVARGFSTRPEALRQIEARSRDAVEFLWRTSEGIRILASTLDAVEINDIEQVSAAFITVLAFKLRSPQFVAEVLKCFDAEDWRGGIRRLRERIAEERAGLARRGAELDAERSNIDTFRRRLAGAPLSDTAQLIQLYDQRTANQLRQEFTLFLEIQGRRRAAESKAYDE
jgi:hypothetical protein